MSDSLDRERLARIIGMVGSTYDGEALAGARQADKLIRAAGLTWPDVLAPCDELRVAVEAARQLFAENEALQAELEEYRSDTPIARFDDWHSVGDHRHKA